MEKTTHAENELAIKSCQPHKEMRCYEEESTGVVNGRPGTSGTQGRYDSFTVIRDNRGKTVLR